MERNFLKNLIKWKENGCEMPLMVIGARQTGKTYIIQHFCEKYFEKFVYINLEFEEEIKNVFEKTLKPEEIIKYIEIIKEINIDYENTVIFLDEIQVSERAIMALKYFCESKEQYKIITAGSLLGVKINRFKSSFPVGKVKIEYLYPMTFDEFLMAKGKQNLIEEITKCYNEKSKMLDSIHELALREYKEYLCIGGMPKAVSNYIENGCDIAKFDRSIHEDIILSYIADMRKYVYTSTEAIRIQKVYETIPLQLGKENKKFKYSLIEKGSTRKMYELPLQWLIASNLLLQCSLIKLPQIPLKAYQDMEYFKLYMSDVGLLNCISRISYADIVLEKNYIFKGAIAENYVAQHFKQKGYDLYYWRAKNEAEIDYLLYNSSGIIPVEVKASDNVKSKSLSEYIKKYKPEYSIRISHKNFGFDNNIYSIPIYATFLI